MYLSDNFQNPKIYFAVYCYGQKIIEFQCVDLTCGLQPPSLLVRVLADRPERKATVLHLQLFQFPISAPEMMLLLL